MPNPFPATVEYQLSGGPCDGKTLDLNASFMTTGTVYCGGARYQVIDVNSVPVTAIYVPGSDTAAPSSDPTLTELAAHAPKTLSGWGDFRQSFNKRLPNALSRAEKLDRQTVAAVGRAVRGK